MEVLLTACAGLDVHKAFVIACQRRHLGGLGELCE